MISRITLMLLFFFTSLVTQAASPIISGYSFSHQSNVLKQERRYMVSLPENYRDNSLNYPTLYVIDSDFQFQHVSAVANNLARMGKIPPMIVVGIANQGNDDYLYHTTWKVEGEPDFGGAAQFYQYISDELVPLIDKTYRTNHNRIMSGYSLGGLFTTYSLIQDNTPFNAFLAFSPSYWVDDYSATITISEFIKNNPSKRSPLFLSRANEKGMGLDKLEKNLKDLNLNDWHWQVEQYPNENHFSTALPAIHDGLTFLFGNFYEDAYALAAHSDYQAVLATFDKKKMHYNGFRIEWLQAYKFAQYVFSSKQTDQIVDILAAVKKQFPESLEMVTNYLAKGYNVTKQPQKAKLILEQVKSTDGENTALWHHQYSLALAELEEPQLAKQHQDKAMVLAKQQQLPMWQIWEMR